MTDARCGTTDGLRCGITDAGENANAGEIANIIMAKALIESGLPL